MSALSFGPVGWSAIVVGSLIVFGVVAGSRFGGFLAAADVAWPYDDDTEPAQYPPPVPPSLRVVTDADWLADQPTSVLSRSELDERFFSIVDSERRWFA